MATDGQGVILATPHSVDARQRTAVDLLTRRVAHRLGCPAATGQVQHGVLHLGAPMSHLHAKGVRDVVVVPLTFIASPVVPDGTSTHPAGNGHPPGMNVRTAEPLGGEPEVIAAVIEALNQSERPPDPRTRVVMLLPYADHPVTSLLSPHVPAITAAGWRDGRVMVMPTNPADCTLNGALDVGPQGRVLLVPLTITPGPFSSRVAECAARLGTESANVSLHSCEALTKLICRRVVAARRA